MFFYPFFNFVVLKYTINHRSHQHIFYKNVRFLKLKYKIYSFKNVKLVLAPFAWFSAPAESDMETSLLRFDNGDVCGFVGCFQGLLKI